MATIDEYSVTALPIEMRFGATSLASGTGFTYETGGSLHLMTNWHNVTGKDPNTNKHLSPSGGEPDRIVVPLPVLGHLGAWRPIEIRLFDIDDEPVWLEHPVHGRKVDVVAIPLTLPPGSTSYPINKASSVENMRMGPGQEVFVLGFPFGLTGSGALPIWKRGSLATEPDLDLDGLPKMFIDTASRSGMSGSPVILRTWGSYTDTQGGMNLTGGSNSRFIGVYSGRIGADDEFKAQLGVVWKNGVLAEIIQGRKRGSI